MTNTVRRAFVDGRYGQIHTRVVVPEQAHKPPVVCLHMSPKSGRSFADVLPWLAKDRVALAPDYPGHGESDPPPAEPHVSIADFAASTWTVIDALGSEPVHLVGYHTGAMVAVEASGLVNGRVSDVWDGARAPPPHFTVATGRGDCQATFIEKVFAVIRQARQHTFQILTKRAERMTRFFETHTAPPHNAWLGVSVENRSQGVPRIRFLQNIPAPVRFLSIEPLLEDLGTVDLTGIHWVIVGGESGPGARPMAADWVRNIRDQCVTARVPFFFKQWGTLRNNPFPEDPTAKKNGGTAKGGRLLDGRTWDEMP